MKKETYKIVPYAYSPDEIRLRINGDSMKDKKNYYSLFPGDLIFCTPIKLFTALHSEKPIVIETHSGYIIGLPVALNKRVLTLRFWNPEYEPCEIEGDQIKGAYKIEHMQRDMEGAPEITHRRDW